MHRYLSRNLRSTLISTTSLLAFPHRLSTNAFGSDDSSVGWEDQVLTLTDASHMCPESQIYGKEVTKPFLSRLWRVGYELQGKSNFKRWQLRTITVNSPHGPRHFIFPFVINSGGITPYVGQKVADILKSAGGRQVYDVKNGHQIINVNVPLIPRSIDRVFIWENEERYDKGRNDLRNNMIGSDQSTLIIQVDRFVRLLKEEYDPKLMARFIADILREYPEADKQSLEMEMELTYSAPISSIFPPQESQIPLCKPLTSQTAT